MNIVVCLKQVPGTTRVRIDPETNTLIREGIENVVNTFDTYALEEGVCLRERYGGKVTAVSMGPPQAEGILRDAISVGADEAIYVTRGIDIISANRLSTMDQGPVYYYILDIGYKLFGVNAFSSRLPGILFGSLSVILIYFIGKEFFNKKKAMIASFLFAVSGYSIKFITELDMLMTFFLLFSIYFFIKGLKYHEIAEVCDISNRTVEKYINKALIMIRKYINE